MPVDRAPQTCPSRRSTAKAAVRGSSRPFAGTRATCPLHESSPCRGDDPVDLVARDPREPACRPSSRARHDRVHPAPDRRRRGCARRVRARVERGASRGDEHQVPCGRGAPVARRGDGLQAGAPGRPTTRSARAARPGTDARRRARFPMGSHTRTPDEDRVVRARSHRRVPARPAPAHPSRWSTSAKPVRVIARSTIPDGRSGVIGAGSSPRSGPGTAARRRAACAAGRSCPRVTCAAAPAGRAGAPTTGRDGPPARSAAACGRPTDP